MGDSLSKQSLHHNVRKPIPRVEIARRATTSSATTSSSRQESPPSADAGVTASQNGKPDHEKYLEIISNLPSVGTRVGRRIVNEGLRNEVEAGTVIKVNSKRSFEVLWDMGKKQLFMMDRKYQTVSVLESVTTGFEHLEITCHACPATENLIAGTRWKCMECYDYDLCTSCYMNNKHNTGHRFIRFDKKNFNGYRVPPRSSSNEVVQSLGLFPGAIVLPMSESSQIGRIFKSYTRNVLREQSQSVVEVQWLNGQVYDYQIPLNGDVELQCVEAANGLPYYWDHLLKCSFQAEDLKQIFSHSQRVECTLPVDILQPLMERTGEWDAQMAKVIGKEGTVQGYMANNNVVVQYPPLTDDATQGRRHVWIFNPATLEKSTSISGTALPHPTTSAVVTQRTRPSSSTPSPAPKMNSQESQATPSSIDKGERLLEEDREIIRNLPLLGTRVGRRIGTERILRNSWQTNEFVKSKCKQMRLPDPQIPNGYAYDFGKVSQRNVNEVEAGTVFRVNRGVSFDVLWDMGEDEEFIFGLEYRPIAILDSAPAGVQHLDIKCNACQTSENRIAGYRWKCMECYSLDLCTSCYMNNKHNTDHRFIRFNKENCNGHCIPPRSSSIKVVQSVGLFPGAIVQKTSDWLWDEQDDQENFGKILTYINIADECPRSAVEVRWYNDEITYDRVGLYGGADLKCVRSAKGLPYYWDHLLECSVEDQDLTHVFDHHQRVKCTLSVDLLEPLVEANGKWESDLKNLIGKEGIVKGYMANSNVIVQYHPLTLGDASQEQRYVWIFHPAALETCAAHHHLATSATPASQQTRPSSTASDTQLPSSISSEPSTSTSQSTTPAAPTAPLMCESCDKDLASVVFHPCGHITVCEACSIRMNKCMICKASIQSKTDAATGNPVVIEEQSDDRTDVRECEICMERDKDTAFVPCGHGACNECAQQVNQCHICRGRITSYLRTYF